MVRKLPTPVIGQRATDTGHRRLAVTLYRTQVLLSCRTLPKVLISPSRAGRSWVCPAESPLREGRDGAPSLATEADYCGTAQTQPHPRSSARSTTACIASDLTVCNVKFPRKVAARDCACAGLWTIREVELVVGFSSRKKRLGWQGWEPNDNPPLLNHPLIFSIYLLSPALPRPPQPTPGWANRCSSFQALSQVSADLAAPRNGPSGPVAARTPLHSALLTAPGAPRRLGEVRAGVQEAQGTREPCRPRLLLARLLRDRIKGSCSARRGRECCLSSFASVLRERVAF